MSRKTHKKFTSIPFVPACRDKYFRLVGDIDSALTGRGVLRTVLRVEVDKARRSQTVALAIAALHTDQSTFTRAVTQHYACHHNDLASFLVEIPLSAGGDRRRRSTSR